MDSESLAHTKWNCKYHIVFAPKYRRQVVYGRLRTEIGKILRELCRRKEIEILEAEACPDHMHMLLSIPPKYSVSSVMGYLKGKSSLMIFDRFANLKYKSPDGDMDQEAASAAVREGVQLAVGFRARISACRYQALIGLGQTTG